MRAVFLVLVPVLLTCPARISFPLDDGAVVMEVDHEKQVVYTEPLVLSPRDAPSLLAAMQPSQENTAQRLTSPIVSTHLNTRNISFERYWPRRLRRSCEPCRRDRPHSVQCFYSRNKSGIWGWRSEKTEVVSGYEAKVTQFNVSGEFASFCTGTEYVIVCVCGVGVCFFRCTVLQMWNW